MKLEIGENLVAAIFILGSYTLIVLFLLCGCVTIPVPPPEPPPEPTLPVHLKGTFIHWTPNPEVYGDGQRLGGYVVYVLAERDTVTVVGKPSFQYVPLEIIETQKITERHEGRVRWWYNASHLMGKCGFYLTAFAWPSMAVSGNSDTLWVELPLK